METIKRVISLEDFKSRFNNKYQYLDNDGNIKSPEDESNNWGFIPLDVSFNEDFTCTFDEIKDRILVTNGIDTNSNHENIIPLKNVFRYKDIVRWKKWIEDYANNSKYYMLCKKGNNIKWVEIECDFFETDYSIGKSIVTSYTFLPLINSNSDVFNIGDIIEVNVQANVLNDIFRIKDENKRFELYVYKFIIDYFNGNPSCIPSIPFMDIPLFIKQECDSIGVLTSSAKEWDPKRTYYKGEIIIYDKETYILSDGDKVIYNEITGEFYNTLYKIFIETDNGSSDNNFYYSFVKGLPQNINSPNEIVYNKNKRNIYYIIENGITHFHFPSIAHKAKYDNITDEFIFNKNYWEKNEVKEVLEADNTSSNDMKDSNYQHESISESRLKSVRRYKKSIDDDGNTLPFIIGDDGNIDTELIFKVGISNMYLSESDIVRADIVNKIHMVNDLETEAITFSYTNSNEILIEKKMSILFDDPIPPILTLNVGWNKTLDIIYLPDLDTFTYYWLRIDKYDKPKEGIEYKDNISAATEDNLGEIIYISSYTENAYYYFEYECKIKNRIAIYRTTTNDDVVIRPSHMLQNSGDYLSNSGDITYYYTIGGIIEEEKNDGNYVYKENTGIKYTEKYPYEIITYGVNYVLPNDVEKLYKHTYSIYDYTPKEDDTIIDSEINHNPSYEDIGDIYKVNDVYSNTTKYKRILSDYTVIDAHYDDGYVSNINEDNVDNYENNIILSNIGFTVGQTVEDSFQKDNTIKNDYLIGIEDCKESIDINIERGSSSLFERMHILSEVKSFSDLENYRNNYFEI